MRRYRIRFAIDWYRRRLLGRPVARAMAVFVVAVEAAEHQANNNNVTIYGERLYTLLLGPKKQHQWDLGPI